jgi:hypothetical protein
MHRHRSLGFVPALVRWLVLGLLVAATSSGCGAGSPPGEGYEIIGFVVESQGTGDDGPPIAGAMIRFQSDTGRVAEGVSESDGRYRLFIVSDTRFGQISATAAGFQEARETVFFDSPSRRVDLVLPRDGAMTEP